MRSLSEMFATKGGRRRALSAAWQIGIAGTAIQGVTFGFARYGYGLFLPEIRDEFALSVSLVGVIGSASYVSYLIALILVGSLSARLGPRPLVVAGGVFAVVGMVLVARAQGVGMLVAGLVMAGSSPGFAWAPFSDAIDRLVPAERRQLVMAVIPSGTALAVAVAGSLAIVATGPTWHYAWTIFAAVALVVTVYNARVLPGRPHRPATPRAGFPRPRLDLRWIVRLPALPLYATGLSYGLIGAVYWTFAVDAVSQGVTEGDRTGPLFATFLGLVGTAGIFTGVLIARCGMRGAQRGLFLAMASGIALLGVAPQAIAAVAASGLLFGPAFMAGSGLLAVWAYQVFPERPSAGFSATVFFVGIGTIVGPATLGAFADRYTLGAAFLLTAAIAVSTLLARPGRAAASASHDRRPRSRREPRPGQDGQAHAPDTAA